MSTSYAIVSVGIHRFRRIIAAQNNPLKLSNKSTYTHFDRFCTVL